MNMKVVVVWDAQLSQCLLRNCSSVGLIGDSLEKTLILVKIAGRRRRGRDGLESGVLSGFSSLTCFLFL